jgi:hypothetical protein
MVYGDKQNIPSLDKMDYNYKNVMKIAHDKYD